MIRTGRCILLIAAFACSGTALAGTIPGVIFNGDLNGANTTLQSAGTLTSAGCNGDMGCEQATLTLAYGGGDASATANGTTTGPNPDNAAGGGSVTYYYEVTGPANGVAMLVFSASGTTSASGTDTSAAAQAFSAGGAFYACSGTGDGAGGCSNGSGGVLPSAFAGSKTFTLAANTLSDIEVVISGGSTLGPGSWSTSVDPQLSFAPGFDSAGYAIVASPSLAPVPLPASAWLLLAGLMGLGAMARHRPAAHQQHQGGSVRI